jgi:hypothetical protein
MHDAIIALAVCRPVGHSGPAVIATVLLLQSLVQAFLTLAVVEVRTVPSLQVGASEQ